MHFCFPGSNSGRSTGFYSIPNDDTVGKQKSVVDRHFNFIVESTNRFAFDVVYHGGPKKILSTIKLSTD